MAATNDSTIYQEKYPKIMESSSHDEILSRENSYEAKLLIPVTVYLVFLMIIGVFGNILVLYVYKFRFRRSTSRVFILSLAAFDLITCLFGMPYHILDLTFPYTFVWSEVCKTLSFALTFTILGSIFVLDLIAIDRYRKICTPFEKQLSAVGTKIVCWVTVSISGFLAVPIIFIYGTADVGTRIPNITGKECYISNKFADTEFPIFYTGFNIFVFVVSVFILAALYIKVGLAIRKRKKFHESVNVLQRSTSEPGTPIGSIKNTTVHDIKLESLKEKDPVVRTNSNSSIARTGSAISYSPYNSPRIQRKGKANKLKQKVKRMMSDVSSSEYDSSGTLERGQTRSYETNRSAFKKQRRTMRITGMLFIITLIFIISFLPYLTIEGMNNMDDTFWENMEVEELIIYNLLMRTYFINNMVNPIVYWCLDKKFKEEVIRVFGYLIHCRFYKAK